MLSSLKGAALDAFGHPLAKGLIGGVSVTVAFRSTTGVRDPFVLGCVFAAGSQVAMRGVKHEPKVSTGNSSTDNQT
ncbi:hypothetical protein VPHD148_0187 [Vibrio phage D148]